MLLEIKLDASCKEPKIIIVTDQITPEVSAICALLSTEASQVIAGFRENTATVLEQADIIRIYASAGKIFAVTSNGEYSLRLRLYEIESRLDAKTFVRISNSEIINLKSTKGFDLSFAGTICVKLSNGTVTYVSRRYVSKIKQVLGM